MLFVVFAGKPAANNTNNISMYILPDFFLGRICLIFFDEIFAVVVDGVVGGRRMCQLLKLKQFIWGKR